MSIRTLLISALLVLACLLESSVRGEALPPGVRARLGTTRFRVGDARGCLAVSPDGKLLASGGDSSVRLWNRDTGEQVRAIALPVARFAVFHVAFSSDGKYFAAIGEHYRDIVRRPGDDDDNSVFVGEAANGKILHSFRGPYTSLLFSPDSARLFAHGGRGSNSDREYPVVVWHIGSGKQQRKFPNLLSYALSPNGKILAGGDSKGTVYLWDVKSGEERGRLQGHSGPIRVLAFAPDGRTLAAANGEFHSNDLPVPGKEPKPDFRVRLWDADSGKERLPSQRYAREIKRLAFAPDGKTFVAIDDDNSLYIRDAVTGRLRQRFPDDSRSGDFFLYSPDSKYLLYEGSDDRFHQWDIAADKETRRWRVSERFISRYLFSAEGKTLFSLSDSIRAWDFATGAEEHPEPDHRARLRELTFSADGKSLATVDDEQRLRVWDAVRGTVYPALDGAGVVRCAFAPDGRRFISIAQDTTIRVRDVPSGRTVRRFRVGNVETHRLWAKLSHSRMFNLDLSQHPHACCIFDGDRRVLAVADADQCIHLWDVMSGEELRRLEGHRGFIEEFRFSPDGKRLFSCGTDNTLRLWDASSGRELQRFQEDGTASLRFALSEDGRLLAWVGGGRIHLWDLPAGKDIGSFKGHGEEMWQVFVERDGAVVVSSGRDGAIRCWDTKTSHELRAIDGGEYGHGYIRLFTVPAGRVLAYAASDARSWDGALYEAGTGQAIVREIAPARQRFAVAPDGRTVVVAGDKLVFRETASGGIVAETPSVHRGRVTCLAFSPDGHVLATGGEDTTVLLWDWRRLTGLASEEAAKVGDKDRETAWTDLASPDARKAYRAIGILTASGDKSVSLLRQHLPPVTSADRDHWRRLFAELDDADFAIREKATQELTQLGVEAYFFLHRAAAEKVPLETRRRLQQILASVEMKRPSAASLRTIRAVQVLEAIGTPAARELLTDWSRGDDDAWLIQEAKSALGRSRREESFKK